ncbi:MAG: hypothetical protein IJS96_03385 [Schwartzia sp.]|nr:hypothetical protein [Schwartzia sp. (in: firmicutes)]
MPDKYLNKDGLAHFKEKLDTEHDEKYLTRDQAESLAGGGTINVTLSENDFMTTAQVDAMFENAVGQSYASQDASFMTSGQVDTLFSSAMGESYASNDANFMTAADVDSLMGGS